MPPKRDEKAWEKINRDLQQAQSRISLSSGGLPNEAVRRLNDILADKRAPFSANFTVNEFLATKSTGYLPVAQVSGSSIYHLGWQTLPYFSSGELEVITKAQSALRMSAVSRIQQEARLLKADGVIGVKRHQHEYDWGTGLMQYTLVGTAIRLPGSTINPHPFVSTLDGQEFWSLYSAGFYPAGYAYGNSAFYQIATATTRSAMGEEQEYEGGPISTKWFNQEIEDFTDAINMARSLAEMRLQTDISDLQATGVIGLTFDRKIRYHERTVIGKPKGTDMSVSIELTGTAVVKREDRKVPQIDYRVWLS
jgi:uncharacterized protein YbjQ (UPF0145 family)